MDTTFEWQKFCKVPFTVTVYSNHTRALTFQNFCAVPPRAGRDTLLDRYRQHTDKCVSCRRAHAALYMIRDVGAVWGVVMIALAAALSPSTTIASINCKPFFAAGVCVCVCVCVCVLLASLGLKPNHESEFPELEPETLNPTPSSLNRQPFFGRECLPASTLTLQNLPDYTRRSQRS